MASLRESRNKKYDPQLFKYSKILIRTKRLAFILALANDGYLCVK